MNISAVILSESPVVRAYDGPFEVVNYVSEFRDAAGLLRARLAALRRVKSEWFFYLDDDDELPTNISDVLLPCISAGTPLAYTDEVMVRDGFRTVRRGMPYSEVAAVANPMLLHHLVVCRTDAALAAAKIIPRGMYTVENLLFFQVAKGGATYVPQIGYIWNRHDDGLSRNPSVAVGQVRSTIWAQRNRGVSNG